MRRYINWILNGFALTFAVPSLLIIISWNAIPGGRLYGIKTGLEDIALGLTIKTPLASILTVKYTERRFAEANTLLSQSGSTLGYSLLVTEATDSKNLIVEKYDKTQARELTTKIDTYKKEISRKKLAIESGNSDIPLAATSQAVAQNPPPGTQQQGSPTSGEIPTQTTNNRVPTPLPTPTAQTPITAGTQEEVLADLEETEEQLEEIQEALNDVRSLPGFQQNPGIVGPTSVPTKTSPPIERGIPTEAPIEVILVPTIAPTTNPAATAPTVEPTP